MFEAKLTEGNIFKKIVEAIKDVVNTVNIDVSPAGKLSKINDQFTWCGAALKYCDWLSLKFFLASFYSFRSESAGYGWLACRFGESELKLRGFRSLQSRHNNGARN